MKNYDRDYLVGSISVIQEQRRQAMSVLDDMGMRIDELDVILGELMDEAAEHKMDAMLIDAWYDGIDAAEAEQDKIIYDSARKKHCMCDACWSDHTDTPGYRMD